MFKPLVGIPVVMLLALAAQNAASAPASENDMSFEALSALMADGVLTVGASQHPPGGAVKTAQWFNFNNWNNCISNGWQNC